ncbi:XRE family transcriptional regulator [Spirosoma jeollabukense]
MDEIVLEMTLGQKLKFLRENRKKLDKSWTMDFVASQVGVTKGAISQYENDINAPSTEVLYSLSKLFDINVEELLDLSIVSIGEVSKKRPGEMISGEKAKLFLSEIPEKDAELYIPYYDVEITAGKIEQYFDEVDEIPEGYVYAPQYQGCVMCNVKGNSMYDLIYPGARLYVFHLKDIKYIDFGHIYLIVTNSLRILKYIRRHPTDDTKVTLASHNPGHDSWDIEKADILNLFIVKGFENQTAM